MIVLRSTYNKVLVELEQLQVEYMLIVEMTKDLAAQLKIAQKNDKRNKKTGRFEKVKK